MSDRNGGTFRLPGRPWKFSDAELDLPGDPALQGEHNSVICSEIGISEAAIQELEAKVTLIDNFAATMIAGVANSVLESQKKVK